ncbi:hypothetical protein PAEPH01_2473, partial [Pancytospora epiphaga]
LSQNPEGSSDKKTTEKKKSKVNDPVIPLISNIFANVPLNDKATRTYYFQIFTVCNGKHKDLFPEIKINVKVTPPVKFSKEYMKKHRYLEQFSEYDAPNILNSLFNKARDEHKDAFFDMMFENPDDTYFKMYFLMIRKFIKFRRNEAIKVLKEDFRIRDGIIEPGSTELLRLVVWFDIVLSEEYYEGLVEVCNNGERIFKKEDRKVFLLQRIRSIDRHKIEWDKLSSAVVKKLCANEEHKRILIEMSLYCGNSDKDVDEIYELCISQFSISLCNFLLDYILDIFNDIKVYLEEMVIPDVICDEALKEKLEDNIELCNSFASDYLWSFIRCIKCSIWNFIAFNSDIDEEIICAIEVKVDDMEVKRIIEINDLSIEKTELIGLRSKNISEGPSITAVSENPRDVVDLDQH